MMRINVHAFLNHQENAKKRMVLYEELQQHLETSAPYASSRLSHTPKGNSNNILERLVAAKEEAKFEGDYFWVVEIGARDYIAQNIKTSICERVWFWRHEMGMKWKDVAKQIDKSIPTTKKLHEQMLNELHDAIYVTSFTSDFREYLENIGAVVQVS